MDDALKAVYGKLKDYRTRTDLSLRASPFLKPTFTGFDGSEKPLSHRYYQVQGILHLVAMTRFLLGDDCGLGKCVTGDTLVLTDQGLREIHTLRADLSEPAEPGTFLKAEPCRVWTGREWAPIKSFYFDGEKPTKRIQTRYGFTIEGSYRHPLWVRKSEGEGWRRLPDLAAGDFVCIERREMAWPEDKVPLHWVTDRPSNAKQYKTPECLTPELARLLGYFVAEGNSTNPNGFTITQFDPEVHADIRDLLDGCFGWTGNAHSQKADTEIQISSVVLRDFVAHCGALHVKSAKKQIPWRILRSPREVVVQFLRGLFEGDGHALPGSGIEYTSKSRRLCSEVQATLLRFGIVSKVSCKPVNGEDYWRLTIFGDDARGFAQKIGFVTARKNEALDQVLSKNGNPNHDVLPFVAPLVSALYAKLKDATTVRGANVAKRGSGIKQFGNGFRLAMREVIRGERDLTYAKLDELLSRCLDFGLSSEPEFQKLHTLASRRFFYDPVVSIEDGHAPVMDLEIDHDDHSFVGNGFVNHNTLQAITALCFLWERDPNQKVVILTNKSAVGQWCKEFDKFCHSDKLTILRCIGTPAKRKKVYAEFEAATGPTILVMGYATARQDISLIQDWSDYIVIFDEATAFKNPKTQIYKVARHLSERAAGLDRESGEWRKGRVWALTATLIKNHLIEGYGIYSVIVPGLFPSSKNKFVNRFCITKLQRIKGNRHIPIIVGYRDGAIPEFKEKIDPYYLGRPKHEVAKELPPLTTRIEKVGLTKAQKDKYAEALAGLLEIDKTGEEKETTKLTALIYCQQIVDHPALVECEGESEKLETLIDLVTNGEFAEENVIVYSRFRKMVDYMQPILEKKGVKTVRITGAEKDDERLEAMEAFQNPKAEARCALITDAASEAINLQSAKVIIFYDSPWSAGNLLQILGRMIRIGSEHDRCYAIHLCARRTIDEKVLAVLKKKMKLIESIIGKRIKGEDDDVEVAEVNDITEIFDAMKADALGFLNE